MIRVGILGTGFGVKVHLPAFGLDSRAKVIAIYGRDRQKTNQIAKEKNLKAAHDWKAILKNPEVDAVSIALPPTVQAQILPEVLKAKKHAFIEKPVGMDSGQTLKLAQGFEKNEIKTAMDFEFPYLPAWQSMYQKLAELEGIQHVKLNWHVKTTAFSTPNSWKANLALGGGSLNNLACHSLHYIEWIMGQATAVTAHLGHDEMLTDIILEFPQNRKAVLSVSMNTNFGNGHRLEIFGNKGSLTLENTGADYMNGFTLKVKSASGEKTETFPDPTGFSDGRVVAVNRVVKKFLDSIESNQNVGPNLFDGARNQFLMEASRKSSQTGQRVAF